MEDSYFEMMSIKTIAMKTKKKSCFELEPEFV